MVSRALASSFLTAAAAFYTLPTHAKNRCEADLGRVDTNFCIADRHKATDPLQYSWKLNDGVFDLTSRACFASGGSVMRGDTVLAIDRSQNVWYADTSRGKFGSDNLSTARYVIQKLQAEAKANPAQAVRVSVVLFSSQNNCQEWAGGPIAVNREFPCLYVRAASVADQSHVDQLLGLLQVADKKYSQGGLPITSDYGVVADLLASDGIGLNSPTSAGLILFSDGRTYSGETGDAFAYLRTQNYTRAQDAAVAKFGQPALKKFQFLFAMTPVQDPAFDATHADAYDNMCATATALPADCNKNLIDYNNPATWAVNRLDLKAFATRLASAATPAGIPALLVTAAQDIDPALDALRTGGGGYLPIDALSYSINGADPKAGAVTSGRIVLESLPAGQKLKLDLVLKSSGSEIKVPMNVETAAVPNEGADFSDKEMLCKADAPEAATANPKINLNNLQGGSASCGVIAATDRDLSRGLAFLMLVPLVGVAFGLRRRSLLVAAFTIFGATTLSTPSRAAEGGLNALQYRPVVDGVGTTEKATSVGKGAYNVGLFMDYANDSVELGGEKNKRLNSIMDDLVTAHVAMNFGLTDRISLGAHIPYVQKTDLDRDVNGDRVGGGQLGQPSDAMATLKINILNRATYSLGAMPLATFATGNPEYLLGDGTNNYGALFIASGAQGLFSWAFNTGYLQREKPLELKDDRANTVTIRGQFLNFVGVEYRYTQKWSFGSNIQAKITAGEHVDLTRTNPAEWTSEAKFRPTSGLELQAGVGTGLGKGYGSPDYRAFAGVTYIPGTKAEAPRGATSTAKALPTAKPVKAKAKVPAKRVAKR